MVRSVEIPGNDTEVFLFDDSVQNNVGTFASLVFESQGPKLEAFDIRVFMRTFILNFEHFGGIIKCLSSHTKFTVKSKFRIHADNHVLLYILYYHKVIKKTIH